VARQLVVIELGAQADAECVAHALDDFDSELTENGGRWTVTASYDAAALGPVLDALQECLADNGIHSVRVSVDDRKYVMEGAG
jgi:hypothetical protein